MVFKSVESKGELIKSVPTTEQIEDEEFELDFSWILATTDSKENIKNMILNVSEVAEVYIEDYVIPEAETESKRKRRKRLQRQKQMRQKSRNKRKKMTAINIKKEKPKLETVQSVLILINWTS